MIWGVLPAISVLNSSGRLNGIGNDEINIGGLLAFVEHFRSSISDTQLGVSGSTLNVTLKQGRVFVLQALFREPNL